MSLVAYHGTPHAFSTFRIPASGVHFGSYDQAVHACTIKLGRMKPEAFGKLTIDASGWRGRIMKVRLHVQNVKRVKDARTPAAWSRAIKAAKAEGYDALAYANNYEGRQLEDSYVVFDANLIEIVNPYCNAAASAA